MSLNTSGSNPVISINFGGIDFGRCTIFFKEATTLFYKKATFDNENSSNFSFEIDPEKLVDLAGLSNLIGCTIKLMVTFVDIASTPGSRFSFDIKIEQDGTLLKSFSKSGTIDDTSVTFTEDYNI
jgi:hypothetical protein